MPHFTLVNHGTISLLLPLTPEAETWIEEHIPDDAPTIGAAIAIEHRYVDAIVTGIYNDGLTVN